MSDLISRQALCDDLREYKVHPVPVSSDESEVKGYNDGIDLAISVIAKFPSAKSEMLTIEELSNQLGCATIQSAFYWFEFLKTLDLLGFAIIRKETK
jgi:hypothetical protein